MKKTEQNNNYPVSSLASDKYGRICTGTGLASNISQLNVKAIASTCFFKHGQEASRSGPHCGKPGQACPEPRSPTEAVVAVHG